tara:strand:+ start:222 stop:1082 length:861 start_codon:yes stop_codon:yes gene_type:complete
MIIWLASYPKSGNTWLRFYIISLLMGKKTDLNLNHLRAIINYPHSTQFVDLVSDLFDFTEIAKNWIPSQKKINSDKSLRFFKTHNMLGKFKGYPFTNSDNTLGTIYIVRDPRNVITSLKNHYSLSDYDEAKKFLFNENKILGLSTEQKNLYLKSNKFPLTQFVGSWKSHYLSWRNMKKNNLLIRYEDLVQDTKNEFTKIASFVGDLLKLKFSDNQINSAINLSSFEKLEKMEEKFGFSESNIGKDGKKNKFFFLGPKNDWSKILDVQVSNDIEREFAKEMKELKYI